TVRMRVLANAPVVPLRNPTAPPFAADTPAIFTLTVGALVPEGLVTRIRHGDGDHVTNRASGVMLLLICSSTSIVMPSQVWRPKRHSPTAASSEQNYNPAMHITRRSVGVGQLLADFVAEVADESRKLRRRSAGARAGDYNREVAG